jgi:hypothetical protein
VKKARQKSVKTKDRASVLIPSEPKSSAVLTAKSGFPAMELLPGVALLSVHIGETEAMLIERGLQVMNVEVVGDAYAIASNYLRRTGAISETIATNDQLLEIIMALFQRGEFNKIKLANKAIAQFEAAALV